MPLRCLHIQGPLDAFGTMPRDGFHHESRDIAYHLAAALQELVGGFQTLCFGARIHHREAVLADETTQSLDTRLIILLAEVDRPSDLCGPLRPAELLVRDFLADRSLH